MGRGGQNPTHPGTFNWDEVKTHKSHEDRWIVIDGQVYDVTEWSKRHPGGSRVIGHYAGQDATVSNFYDSDNDTSRKHACIILTPTPRPP